jgi:hypothetical protein
LKGAEQSEEIVSLSGMIKLRAAQCLCAPATSHIESMDGVPGFECCLGEAARVTGIARTLQAVHNQQLGWRFPKGTLRMDQHLNVGGCAEELGLYGKSGDVQAPRPEVSRDGESVGIRE